MKRTLCTGIVVGVVGREQDDGGFEVVRVVEVGVGVVRGMFLGLRGRGRNMCDEKFGGILVTIHN